VSFKKYLPPTHTREEIAALQAATSSLQRSLKVMLEKLSIKALALSSGGRHKLAEVLVEFVYDLQNGIGLWLTLERYNREFFGTPLPFVLRKNQKIESLLISPYRLQYLLWCKYSHYKPDMIMSPTHKGLVELATQLALFINQHIRLKMKAPSIGQFLFSDNEYGWDVKRKLVWLGQYTYLFRDEYQAYMDNLDGEQSIERTDDFICQETTAWSGLGVIDFLAHILNINESQQAELKSWYERHVSVYEIVTVTKDVQIAKNIVTRENYTIRTNQIIPGMVEESFVYGSLVPWSGEWYWSGTQNLLGQNLTENIIQEIKTDLTKRSAIVYRYAKDLLKQAQEHTEKYYTDFVKQFGDELVIFPDGYKMAAALQNMSKKQFENLDREAQLDMQEKHSLKNPWSNFNFPQNLLENDDGIGLFFEKSEGLQMMTFFSDVQSGLEKRGERLNDDELEALRGFIMSHNTSPSFVSKLLNGPKIRSIKEAFLLRNQNNEMVVQFLLRKYKGDYFRNHYPNMSVV